ncbi:L10-interacting MYB domain-containing protein-like [Malania oleifera]|uniref:L10-interacting MYB domain-containing protein-like n=1 Tax=Malania oleifera TaxID=397392 RepID=UPI0025ADD08E|nr:L10-interacting MYB domain-containing protein-like [Malania oleifera]XP_057963708.1 L10-interacting MYB domain-containing protein-like [Malania oleifera]XP_057963709.1 L10-interacting MYB domain-containing protein-like [Malania oleifera]
MSTKQKGKRNFLLKNKHEKLKAGAKAIWDPKATKIFIELCKSEVLAGNQHGNHLRNPVWKTLAPKFNELTGKEYEQNQLKNKWDSLRKDWLLWKTLISCATGLGFDYAKGPEADDDWWEARLKVVPNAVKFRKTGAPMQLDDLEIMFKHTVANGESVSAFNLDVLPEEENVSRKNDPQLAEGGGDSKEGDNISLEKLTAGTIKCARIERENEGMQEETDNEFNSQKEKERNTIGGAAKFSRQLDHIMEVKEGRSSAKSSATSMMTNLPGSSIADVMELMENIPDIEPGSELYMLGTRLFMKSENREMFVALKRPHVRLVWLKQELAREGQNNTVA